MIARHVTVQGLEHVPATGPAIVVANHPTGIADGVVLFGALAQRRPDLFIFTNADALRVLPQLEAVLAPVEWRPEKRSHKQNRETLAYAHRAFGAGRMAVIFPRAGWRSGAGCRCTSGPGWPRRRCWRASTVCR